MKCLVVGAGVSGLVIAYFLNKLGHKVCILEKESFPGGLAAGFEVERGIFVERFYHHWFSNDVAILQLIHELKREDKLVKVNSNTGFFYANSIFRLANPIDLLTFSPLSFLGRLRLGFLALAVRRVKSFEHLESITAVDWIRKIAGTEVAEKVWIPLLKGKFGKYFDKIAAVWLWNKLKLRGSSRDKLQREYLFYYRGGFHGFCMDFKDYLEQNDVKFYFNEEVIRLKFKSRIAVEVETKNRIFRDFDVIFLTPPLPIIKNLLKEEFEETHQWSISFLANRCLILVLKRSLSSTYWLNVADPTFPFVGIIEHTNLDPPENYSNYHLAYLSKYLEKDDPLFEMPTTEYFEFAVPFIKKIFPSFSVDWVVKYFDWRADYAQPIVEINYPQKIPPFHVPDSNIFICTMAQIYPEDRGTNYAVEYGKRVVLEFQKRFDLADSETIKF
jgi:protoporphyrinogen oxidase